MHRTNSTLRTVIGMLLLGYLLSDQITAGAQQPGDPQRPARTVSVPVGSSRSFDMKGKGGVPLDIQVASVDREDIATVLPGPDAKSIRVTGRAVGRTRLTMKAPDNTVEEFDLIVEMDIEYLKTILQKAAPTATINATAIGGLGGAPASVVLAGNAGASENINILMRTAESVAGGPGRVINAMSVDGVMQVQLDCVVALVSRSKARRMALDLFNVGFHHTISNQLGGGVSAPATGTGIGGSIFGLPTITNITGPQGAVAPNVFVGLYENSQWLFAFLQILKTENIAKTLAEPRMVVMSGRTGYFLSGGEQAVPSQATLGVAAIAFSPFGTKLTFLPYVMNNGKIFLDVEPEVSDLSIAFGTNVGGGFVPGRVVQRVHTSIEMEAGQTFVIGGMIKHDVGGTVTKVPVLGDLPFVGAAFSQKVFTDQETELLILVTPHLVDAMTCDKMPKILPGQETRNPDDFELFLEQILEAPRGPRPICVNGHYQAAWKNGPTAQQYPCAGQHDQFMGGGGVGGGVGCGPTGCAPSAGSGLANPSTIGYPSVNGQAAGAAEKTNAATGSAETPATEPGRSANLGAPEDLPEANPQATPPAGGAEGQSPR